MGAGVDHAVLDVVVGQVLVVPAAERELQHLHAREGAVCQQLPHAGEELPQILGDDGQLAQRTFQRVEQLHPGAGLPLAGLGGSAVCRDGPVGIKTTEVVDAEQVIDAQRMADTLDPPGIAGLLMVGPVVQRVAPELAVCREVIRRAACHPGKAAVCIQLKQRAAHPGIHGICRDIDGDIAQDLYVVGVGVGLQLLPLDAELVLQKLPEADLFLVLCLKSFQRLRLPLAVLPGPLGPALHAVGGLEGHVEGIILQPALVFQREGIVRIRIVIGTAVLACTLPAPGGVGGAQDLVAAGVQGAVIHIQRVLAPRLGLELGSRQQPLGFQSIQINEIRVARKGRAALVGAVPIARGAQGQDLPDLLACRRKEIHKFFCLFAKAADPVGAGQAGHRHQNTTFTHCKSFLVSNFLLGLVCFLS